MPKEILTSGPSSTLKVHLLCYMKTFKFLLLVKKKSHCHRQMPQFKPRFLGLKKELLGRRQPVSWARGETERSQGHHCPLGNKLQFSMSEPRSHFFTGEKGNANKAPVFNGTLSKSQILLLCSPSLHQKNLPAHIHHATWQCSFLKRSGTTMCKWCDHSLPKLQHLIKNSHHVLRFRTGFSWLSPSWYWQQRYPELQIAGWVSVHCWAEADVEALK